MVERSNLQVIVVGGGIAGLTMALSLHQAGIAVRVYEAVREPRALGVGINCCRLRCAN
jgi:2-polyprenyl-6-methoxyphenol hydroxylase-like FAD-dependent oxidoreductase